MSVMTATLHLTREQARSCASAFASHVVTGNGILPVASWMGETDPRRGEMWRVRRDAAPTYHGAGFWYVGRILPEVNGLGTLDGSHGLVVLGKPEAEQL